MTTVSSLYACPYCGHHPVTVTSAVTAATAKVTGLECQLDIVAVEVPLSVPLGWQTWAEAALYRHRAGLIPLDGQLD